MDPTNVSNLNLLGNLYQSVGDITNALSTFETAVATDKKHWVSRLNLSLLLKDIGRTKEAQEQREICIKLHPAAKETFEEFDNVDKEYEAEKDQTGDERVGDDEEGEEMEEEEDDYDDGDFLGLSKASKE